MDNQTDALENGGVRSRKQTIVLLFTVLMLAFVALLATGSMLQTKLEETRSAKSDNRGWTVAQLQVDYLNLRMALNAAQVSEPSEKQRDHLDEIVRAFDIFYSRVRTYRATIMKSDPPAELSRRVGRVVDLRDTVAPMVDSLSATDRTQMARIDRILERNEQLIRETTTSALGQFVQQSTESRLHEQSLLTVLSWLTLFILLMMIAAGALAILLWHEIFDRSRAIARSASNLRKTFEASLDAVLVADIHGAIQYSNDAAARMFNISRRGLMGRMISGLMVSEKAFVSQKDSLFRLRVGDENRIPGTPSRSVARRLDGSEFPVEFSMAVDSDPEGKPILISFIRDISSQVEYEGKLHDAYTAARRHAAAKSRFLAVMSHEMRTPLHGLLAALDLVEKTDLPQKREELLVTAGDCARRALELINNVLSLTKLDDNAEADSVFSPLAVSNRIVSELQPLARESHNNLEVHASGLQETDLAQSKPGAFSSALYNLVGNALKYTEHGNIRVVLEETEANDDRIGLKVSVSDDGPGIAPEDQERIFRDFETLNTGDFKQSGGTGLGLPITLLSVKQLGGDLELDSVPGKGSCFSFELSLKRASPPEILVDDVAAVPAESWRRPLAEKSDVLVVDDNQVNLMLMCEMVSQLGLTPIPAADGGEALETAMSANFELILIDINMPDIDGIEVTKRIRRDTVGLAPLIIGITAFQDDKILAKAHDAGMNRVLLKPVTTNQLWRCIGSYFTFIGTEPQPKTRRIGGPLAEATSELQALVGAQRHKDMVAHAIEDIHHALTLLSMRPIDVDAASSATHHAIGSAAVMGMDDLVDVLRSAEAALRAGKSDEAQQMAKEIGTLVERATRVDA